jgi:hypothetical protein
MSESLKTMPRRNFALLALLTLVLFLNACDLNANNNTTTTDTLEAQKTEPERSGHDSIPDGNDDKSNSPIEICTASQLQDIQIHPNKRYKLICHIHLNHIRDWQAIGTQDRPFTGEFDGNELTINSLIIEDAKRTQAFSLFGVNAGVIKDLTIETFNIAAPAPLASLSSHQLTSGVIQNVHARRVRLAGGSTVGGLVVVNEGKIIDSTFDGDIVPLMKPLVFVQGLGIFQSSVLGNVKNTYIAGIAARSMGLHSEVAHSEGQMNIHIQNMLEPSAPRVAKFHQHLAKTENEQLIPSISNLASICSAQALSSNRISVIPEFSILPNDELCDANPYTPEPPIPENLSIEGEDVLLGGIAADNRGLIFNSFSQGKIGHLVTH